MEIELVCNECLSRRLATEGPSAEPQPVDEAASGLFRVALNDSGVYHVRCPAGHDSYTIIQQEKFELLYDSALLAIRDGHLMEAVSGIAASVERCHEFCVKVWLARGGIPVDEFRQAWKYLAKQTERQIGAFHMLYLQQYKTAAPTHQKSVEFRNRVIHQGYLPTRDEVLKYAGDMLEYMFTVLRKLRETHETEVQQVLLSELRARWAQAPAGARKGSLARPSTINVTMSTPEQFGTYTLDQYLKDSPHVMRQPYT
jgi:hypothetical protein